jgi:predicted dehydrogenase
MVASYVSPHGQGTTIEIYGSDGSLSTPQPDASSPNPPPHGKLYGAKLGEPAQAELAIPERLNPYSDDLLVQDTHDGFMPMRMLAREFVNGVESGTSPSPSFYDAYRCQQVLHAVRESSTTGRIVEIAAAT